jgi:hypothetical protein
VVVSFESEQDVRLGVRLAASEHIRAVEEPSRFFARERIAFMHGTLTVGVLRVKASRTGRSAG